MYPQKHTLETEHDAIYCWWDRCRSRVHARSLNPTVEEGLVGRQGFRWLAPELAQCPLNSLAIHIQRHSIYCGHPRTAHMVNASAGVRCIFAHGLSEPRAWIQPPEDTGDCPSDPCVRPELEEAHRGQLLRTDQPFGNACAPKSDRKAN